VPGLSDITALGVGGSASCALSAQGRVWCWGDNEFGQVDPFAPDSGPIASPRARVAHQVVCPSDEELR
jgi:hypothetical protein